MKTPNVLLFEDYVVRLLSFEEASCVKRTDLADFYPKTLLKLLIRTVNHAKILL